MTLLDTKPVPDDTDTISELMHRKPPLDPDALRRVIEYFRTQRQYLGTSASKAKAEPKPKAERKPRKPKAEKVELDTLDLGAPEE